MFGERAASGEAVIAPVLPSMGPVLTQRRIYVLPTRQGWSFFAVLVLMLIGAVNYNNNLGYLLTFLLASFALVSIFHTYRNLAGLGWRLRPVAPVFAGEAMHLVLRLDNRGQRERPDIFIAIPSAAEPDGGHSRARIDLASDEIHDVTLTVHTNRRGRLRVGRFTIATRFPVGLFRAWSHLEPAAEALVYPRPGGARALPMQASDRALTGNSRARGADDFAGLRSYVLGDSSRRVHWKTAAREQDMMVKQFSGCAAHEVYLRWADAPQVDTEPRLSQLCRWVLEADSSGHRYALELPGERIGSGAGVRHRQRCLRALALYGWPDA